MKAKKTILDTIGSTPMVRINALSPNPKVKIFAKLEGFNPTGSIKDRIAVKMIETAEREGRLTKGKTIIEPTSGNTGIGLAIVGIVKGYPVEIVMSEAVSIERRKIIRAYGGTVRLTPAAEGTDGAIRLARKLVAENPDKYFMPDQFANAANYLAHYENTALEIWQQTGGQIDYLVCAIGTSGTLMGLSRFPAREAQQVPEEIYQLFPVLRTMKQRRGGDLSGGQQQQLAIGRALASRPQLLILDEPTEGIQPSVIKEIGEVIRQLASRGDMAILLVEQFYDFAAGLADHYLVMSRGAIVQQGKGGDMESDGVRAMVTI